jgi:adenylate cyclase
MLSPKLKNTISRIIPFGVIWLIFSFVYTFMERGILGGLDHYPATGNPYSFKTAIGVTPLTALIMGLVVGTIEVLYLDKLFMQKTFAGKIIYKTIIYVAVIVFFLFSLTVVVNSIRLQIPIVDGKVWNNTWAFFWNSAFWSVGLYIASIIGWSLFYGEVSQNLGQGVLHNFFTGKYHTPVEEERVFMFLDMKASTTIAERIGHVKYFEMLKTYFSDLTKPIIEYSGEIYQYVGDEIVVSWKLQNGLQNNNCIRCFFAMKSAIEIQSEKYVEKFGILPGFKAGVHLGKVTTGEIGVVK